MASEQELGTDAAAHAAVGGDGIHAAVGGDAVHAAVGGDAVHAAVGGDARWRERAVERSLRTARQRALTRSDRFIAAAGALLNETGRIDFTVQEIVERSKMSLRSFYQHFASKDELLLALFEELIRSYINTLRADVDGFDDPVDRMHAYVTGLYRSVEGIDHPGSRALTVYHLQLADSHPVEFAHALAPQTALLLEILEAGVERGCFRRDVPPQQLTMILMQTLVTAMHMNVLGIHMTGVGVSAEQLWAFCLGGIAPAGTTDVSGTGDGAIAAVQGRRPASSRR